MPHPRGRCVTCPLVWRVYRRPFQLSALSKDELKRIHQATEPLDRSKVPFDGDVDTDQLFSALAQIMLEIKRDSVAKSKRGGFIMPFFQEVVEREIIYS